MQEVTAALGKKKKNKKKKKGRERNLNDKDYRVPGQRLVRHVQSMSPTSKFYLKDLNLLIYS